MFFLIVFSIVVIVNILLLDKKEIESNNKDVKMINPCPPHTWSYNKDGYLTCLDCNLNTQESLKDEKEKR